MKARTAIRLLSSSLLLSVVACGTSVLGGGGGGDTSSGSSGNGAGENGDSTTSSSTEATSTSSATSSSSGACAPLGTDQDCSRCGDACVRPNATSKCAPAMPSGYACEIVVCDQGFADCDFNASDGCETNVLSDAANCGACANACPQGETCALGACQATSSATTASSSSGGCGPLGTDQNCSACGDACVRPNATSKCAPATPSGYACDIVICDDGYADCDFNAADGCETDTLSDSANCGACANHCPSGKTCVLGACQ